MDKEQEKYIKELEEAISQFLKPLKNIPFKIAIKAMSGCKVIPFDKNNPDDRQLLTDLIEATKIAAKNANQKGIFTRRENEVGNHIEPFMIEALNKIGLKADRPETREGKKKAVGYPDIFVIMSIFERTREIGVMKAIGASNLDIFKLVWLETILVCAAGGIGGSIIAILGGNVVEYFVKRILPYAPSGKLILITPQLLIISLLALFY